MMLILGLIALLIGAVWFTTYQYNLLYEAAINRVKFWAAQPGRDTLARDEIAAQLEAEMSLIHQRNVQWK